MDILVVFDHNYVAPTGVMLKSLVVNNASQILNVHAIIDEDVSEEDKESLREIVEGSEERRITFFNYKKEEIREFPGVKGTHFSKAAYYRLFCASLLPEGIEKILYLDSDMIVNFSLNDLWNTDISDVAIAAVVNPGSYGDSKSYFNSGLLLINLRYWRENHLEDKYVDFILNHSDKIKWVDQDVSNGVLTNSKKLLPLKYNVQDSFLYKKKYLTDSLGEMIGELDDALLNPVVIHFCGSVKPWMIGCRNPYRSLFVKYKNLTRWKDANISNEPFAKLFKRLIRSNIKCLLIRLRLIENPIDRSVVDRIQVQNS